MLVPEGDAVSNTGCPHRCCRLGQTPLGGPESCEPQTQPAEAEVDSP